MKRAKKQRRFPTVATVPIRHAAKGAMFLAYHLADGALPDGRKFTVGAAGEMLTLDVFDDTSGFQTFMISAREMIEILLKKRLIRKAAPK